MPRRPGLYLARAVMILRQLCRARRGPLADRAFRLLFAATTVTTIGDRLGSIALAFAVLDVADATGLGIVLAVRQAVQALVVLGGGVLADRLPRNVVLVGASWVQALAQAATAAIVLSGGASVASLAALAAVYGLGSGLVIPAEVGLVPDIVAPRHLQEANALRGLTRNVNAILGPALGGVAVVAGSPGTAIAIDAATFVVAAILLGRIRVPARPRGATGFLVELREGWREFTSRSWLWVTVTVFGLGNMFFMFWWVLGPAVTDERFGGAGAWAAILALGGAGAVVGGVLALRYRPRRPLVACVVAPLGFTVQFALLALEVPVWALCAGSFVANAGLAVHLALWFTIFQREVPAHAHSRVSAYDTLGSFVLNPVGAAVAGPVAVGLGTDAALWLAAGAILALNLVLLSLPAVWPVGRAAQSAQPVPQDGRRAPEYDPSP